MKKSKDNRPCFVLPLELDKKTSSVITNKIDSLMEFDRKISNASKRYLEGVLKMVVHEKEFKNISGDITVDKIDKKTGNIKGVKVTEYQRRLNYILGKTLYSKYNKKTKNAEKGDIKPVEIFTEFGITSLITPRFYNKNESGYPWVTSIFHVTDVCVESVKSANACAKNIAMYTASKKKDDNTSSDGKTKRKNFENRQAINFGYVKYGKRDSSKFSLHGNNFSGITIDKENSLIIMPNGDSIHYLVKTDYDKSALFHNDENKMENNIVCVTFVRERIRGVYKYWVHFTIKGVCPKKGVELGKGVCGIDLGPREIVIYSRSQHKLMTIPLEGKNYDEIENKVKKINRKLDVLDRAANPENYKSDGTPVEKKFRKKRIVTKEMIALINKKNTLVRKYDKSRDYAVNHILKTVLKMGDTFIIEQNCIKSWTNRFKGLRIDPKTGKFMSNKRGGKSILKAAPGGVIERLKTMVERRGGHFHKISAYNAASQFDMFTGEFTKHKLSERTITLGDGRVHSRNCVAAYNIAYINKAWYDVTDRKLVTKSSDNYDLSDMLKDSENLSTAEMELVDMYKNGMLKTTNNSGISKMAVAM